ncbi:MAG: hypothetical protein ACHQ7N_08510 [Candidatus Methylomirabilales bacterium]
MLRPELQAVSRSNPLERGGDATATRGLWLWRAPWILALCVGLALIGPGLAGVAGAGEKPKLVVWWNKG